MRIARNIALTLICLLLGIMLAWQFKSVNYYESVSSVQNKRLDELREDLITANNQKAELQAKLSELEAENEMYKSVKAGDSAAAKSIQDSLDKARIFAGLTDVKGQGIVVKLDNNEYIYVQDIDILNIVNELRASGAQAISVNEERIVAMSEIRTAGRYIMINGRQLSPPFVVKAISEPAKLERSLRLLGGVVENLEELQLKVEIKQEKEVVILRFVDDGTSIKYDLLIPVK